MKKTICIIFGGRSGEHEISIRSASTVIEQIDHERYEVIPIAISNDGRWLSQDQSVALLPGQTRELFIDRFGAPQSDRYIVLSDSTSGGPVTISKSSGTAGSEDGLTIDCVFPVLHGTYGEDGTIQGLLEMADLPYVGCGVLASSTGMDKAFMKTLFRDAGLPICKHLTFLRDDWDGVDGTIASNVDSTLGFPCFVKPANLGSSVGVSRAIDRESLNSAVALASEYDRKIIVEECLDMREIECAVLGNDSPEASLPGEYIIRDESKVFLDYTEKYSGTGNNEFVVPASVSDEVSDSIRKMAITAFKAIDGSGLARVDFFLRKDTGELLVNEINTMPGLTDASGFPKMWAGTGKAFSQVIDELIEYAIERHADKRRNKTSRA